MNPQMSQTNFAATSYATPTALPVARTQPEVDSRALLAGNPCIAIRHGKDVYWLRATRQGKLLLTK